VLLAWTTEGRLHRLNLRPLETPIADILLQVRRAGGQTIDAASDSPTPLDPVEQRALWPGR